MVIDASITLAWLFKDERTQECLEIRDRAARHGAVVPVLWWLEIANSLWSAERRRRIDKAGRLERFEVLAALPLTTDRETDLHAWKTTVGLAAAHTLSVYDACYLEVALRRRLPLASLDNALRAAAGREGVDTFP